MLVHEIMTRQVKTVTPETPMREVVSSMTLYRLSGLPVVEEADRLVGIIAERDVLHRLFPTLEESMNSMAAVDFEGMETDYGAVMRLNVADMMTPKVITVTPGIPILRAASIMVRHRFRRIPVAENGRLVGMLSLGDVHKAIFKKNIDHL